MIADVPAQIPTEYPLSTNYSFTYTPASSVASKVHLISYRSCIIFLTIIVPSEVNIKDILVAS
jgi:hypothetical protein